MATPILLDTNSLLWLLGASDRLGPVARATISSAPAVYSSPVSVIEIRIKSMLGRLVVPVDLVASMRAAGIQESPLTFEHADALLDFPSLLRHDPFDRMLLAQASTERSILLTADRVLLDAAPRLTQDALA